jgi:GR25 family glycosyltransferase involved in LPS biosynthesis
MIYKVISLKRTPERLELFNKNNPWFEYELFEAIDGRKINHKTTLGEIIADEDIFLTATPGEIGIMLSQKALWEECVKLNQPITIIEDDVYLNPNFKSIVEYHESKNKDMIFWGANIDYGLTVGIFPGISTCEMTFDYPLLLENIENITKEKIYETSLIRLLFALGICCYTIQPKAAKILLELFPIEKVLVRRGDDVAKKFQLDWKVISIIQEEKIEAFLSLPMLAFTKNDYKESTIQSESKKYSNPHIGKL